MSKGLEELKRMAYENACCRCQYYIDKKCTNNGECVWKTIEKELKVLEIIKNKCSLKLEENLDTNYHNYYGYLIIKDKHLFNGTLTLDIKTQEEYDLLKEVLQCQDKD